MESGRIGEQRKTTKRLAGSEKNKTDRYNRSMARIHDMGAAEEVVALLREGESFEYLRMDS